MVKSIEARSGKYSSSNCTASYHNVKYTLKGQQAVISNVDLRGQNCLKVLAQLLNTEQTDIREADHLQCTVCDVLGQREIDTEGQRDNMSPVTTSHQQRYL